MKCAVCGARINKKKNHAYWDQGPKRHYGCNECNESGRFNKWLDKQPLLPKQVLQRKVSIEKLLQVARGLSDLDAKGHGEYYRGMVELITDAAGLPYTEHWEVADMIGLHDAERAARSASVAKEAR